MHSVVSSLVQGGSFSPGKIPGADDEICLTVKDRLGNAGDLAGEVLPSAVDQDDCPAVVPEGQLAPGKYGVDPATAIGPGIDHGSTRMFSYFKCPVGRS